MTMATTTQPSMELRKLQEARDQAHAKVREAKSKITLYDMETELLRADYTQRRLSHPDEFEGSTFMPRPGTDAADLNDLIRGRMEWPNPHRADYDKAYAPYEAADLALQQFKREHVSDRLAELRPDYEQARDTIREAFDLLRQGCEDYLEDVGRAHSIVIDTPGLNGQHLGHDPRPHSWLRLAEDALRSEIVNPGLNARGEARLDV